MNSSSARPRRHLMLLAGILLCASCTESVVPVTLEVLVSQQESFDGRRVRTSGTALQFDSPHHVWIEDAGLNRVELLPAEWLAEYVGRRVEVAGRFSYAADVGRRIQLESVEPAAAD